MTSESRVGPPARLCGPSSAPDLSSLFLFCTLCPPDRGPKYKCSIVHSSRRLVFGISATAHERRLYQCACRQLPKESFVLIRAKNLKTNIIWDSIWGSVLWTVVFFKKFFFHAVLFFHYPWALQSLAQDSAASSLLYYDWLQGSVCACLPRIGLIVCPWPSFVPYIASQTGPLMSCQAPRAPFQFSHSIYFSFPSQTSVCFNRRVFWLCPCIVYFLYYGWLFVREDWCHIPELLFSYYCYPKCNLGWPTSGG